MLKFHPYSILTGDTMVGFVIFCVLRIAAAITYLLDNYQSLSQNSISESKQAFVEKTFTRTNAKFFAPSSEIRMWNKKNTFSRQIFEIDFAGTKLLYHHFCPYW